MPRMLLATHGTNGDVLPFIALGAALRSRGHDVTLITHAHYQHTALDAGLEFVALDTAEEYERQLDDSHLLLNPLRDPEALRTFYRRNRLFEQMLAEFHALRERVVARETVIVTRHTTGLAGLLAAEALGVPLAWVALSPSQLMTLPITTYMYSHILHDGINQVRHTLALPPVQDWRRWLDRPQLQLGLWPDWFAPAEQQWPSTLESVGFMLHDPAEDGELPAAVHDLLREHPRPVLITGGSGQLLHAEFYRVAVETCVATGRPALLVTRHEELIPHPLPRNIHWFARLPFRTLMPHVELVLHHGGMGTLARALWAGVPQLILADGADRPDNAARLHRLGLAEWAAPEEWSLESIAPRLAQLASAAASERCTRFQKYVSPADAQQNACLQLEKLLNRAYESASTLDETEADSSAQPANDRLRDRLRGLTPAQRQALTQRLRTTQPSALPTTTQETA